MQLFPRDQVNRMGTRKPRQPEPHHPDKHHRRSRLRQALVPIAGGVEASDKAVRVDNVGAEAEHRDHDDKIRNYTTVSGLSELLFEI